MQNSCAMTDPLAPAFERKRVLLTGATGFLGSHLARRLVRCGASVHLIKRRSSGIFRLEDVADVLTVHEADLVEDGRIRECVRSIRPQIVFHCAADRNVANDIRLISGMINVNVKGTMNLLEALSEQGGELECFVNTGSSDEYGDGPAPFCETQKESPVSPYAASKVAANYFSLMMWKSRKVPVVILRPFLTHGPYQSTDMFIPSLIRHCLAKRDFPMSTGEQTREVHYVDDVVNAFLLAASNRNAIGHIFNIGNGIEFAVRDIADMIVRLMGNPIRLLPGSVPRRPGEAVRMVSGSSKIRDLLGWKPQTGFEEGLKRTIEWYMIHSERLETARAGNKED